MKRINKIKVGGHLIEVEWSPARKMGGNMGTNWNAHNIIRVCSDFPQSQQEVTVLHELVHHVLKKFTANARSKRTGR